MIGYFTASLVKIDQIYIIALFPVCHIPFPALYINPWWWICFQSPFFNLRCSNSYFQPLGQVPVRIFALSSLERISKTWTLRGQMF